MAKLGTKSLTDAYEKGIPIQFRAESRERDWFACRAEWEEEGVSHYAIGKRFQTTSQRRADHMAEQIMLEQISEWTKRRAEQGG